jgi:hypothetical protein
LSHSQILSRWNAFQRLIFEKMRDLLSLELIAFILAMDTNAFSCKYSNSNNKRKI